MRIAYPALMSLVTVSVVTSVGSAQVLTPLSGGQHFGLDHAVPVATVSRVGDIVAPGGARIVQDQRGEPFVLGAATLDLRDPSNAKIVFTMTNPADTAIALNDVEITAHTMVSAVPDDGRPAVALNLRSGRAARHGGGELQPGATMTVQIPISAPACLNTCRLRGFLVSVGRESPHPPLSNGPSDAAWREVGRREGAILRRAFAKVLSDLNTEVPQHHVPPA